MLSNRQLKNTWLNLNFIVGKTVILLLLLQSSAATSFSSVKSTPLATSSTSQNIFFEILNSYPHHQCVLIAHEQYIAAAIDMSKGGCILVTPNRFDDVFMKKIKTSMIKGNKNSIYFIPLALDDSSQYVLQEIIAIIRNHDKQNLLKYIV